MNISTLKEKFKNFLELRKNPKKYIIRKKIESINTFLESKNIHFFYDENYQYVPCMIDEEEGTMNKIFDSFNIETIKDIEQNGKKGFHIIGYSFDNNNKIERNFIISKDYFVEFDQEDNSKSYGIIYYDNGNKYVGNIKDGHRDGGGGNL